MVEVLGGEVPKERLKFCLRSMATRINVYCISTQQSLLCFVHVRLPPPPELLSTIHLTAVWLSRSPPSSLIQPSNSNSNHSILPRLLARLLFSPVSKDVRSHSGP